MKVNATENRPDLSDALNVPLLRDSLPPTTLAVLNTVSKDVAEVVRHADQWRHQFAYLIGQPVHALKEPPEGLTFKDLRFGHKAFVKQGSREPLTAKEKSDLTAFYSYMRPGHVIEIRDPDPLLKEPVWSRHRVQLAIGGAAACLVSAGLLYAAFFLQAHQQQ